MRQFAGLVSALSLALSMPSASAIAGDDPTSVVPTKGDRRPGDVDRATVRKVAIGRPEGFVEMFVAAVITTEGGPAVVLQDGRKRRLLPIWVGVGEAHAIQLRLERKRFARPLTHDLFDAVLAKLGGEVVKIQVNDLEGDTFVGTVFVQQGRRLVGFDARPSDSIALALGNHAPIFVAEGLLIDMDNPTESEPDSEPIVPEFGIDNPPEGIQTL